MRVYVRFGVRYYCSLILYSISLVYEFVLSFTSDTSLFMTRFIGILKVHSALWNYLFTLSMQS
jgi:hypothetical protein